MKKLLVLIAFLAQLNVEAQTYVPFPASQDSAVWTIYTYRKESGCNGYDLYTNGDTIINNFNYTILGYRGIYYPWYSTGTGSGYCEPFGDVYIHPKSYAYREDNTKKIFFKYLQGTWADSTEFLLYDFGLQLGDSLKGYYANMNIGLNPIVSSIDSILIDNSWRRKINFKNQSDNEEGCLYFIEGIGSSLGFMAIQYCPSFEGTANLECFKLKGDVKYPANISIDCVDYSFITSTPETKAEDYQIQLYPNPSNGQFNLTFETTKAKDVSLTVVDLTGRHIWGENVTALHGKYNRTFGTNNMASGVYMLNILIDGQRSVRKLVVN